MSFNIKLAGIPIEINNKYHYIKDYCADYITTDKPLFSVNATQNDIENEKNATDSDFPDFVLETTCIHREIVKGLVEYGIILIHSAVIAVDGEAYVFLAKSGVGKSTHLMQWKKHFGDKATVLNGDKPLFSFEDDVLNAYGTPWKGKEGWGINSHFPVKAFCFIERGENNVIVRAEKSIIISKLFHQLLMPSDIKEQCMFIKQVNKIIEHVPFYRLKCNISEESAIVSYNGMNDR